MNTTSWRALTWMRSAQRQPRMPGARSSIVELPHHGRELHLDASAASLEQRPLFTRHKTMRWPALTTERLKPRTVRSHRACQGSSGGRLSRPIRL